MSSGAVDTMTAEIRLDKSDFESNCKETLSMLQKLKAALKLDGASAGLKEIEKTSEKLDFRDLNNNIDGVGKHFSKLETIATGVLLKIGMSAAETGMKIAKSLTIDQVAAGWNKYADKTKAVQTIMANLREDEGDFIDEAAKMDYVNGYLEKLMWFSDETSYSFTDMTSNVGKFIANGRGLDESVTAMQGIATWAAISGQNTQTAARAMYNISQALGVGAMKALDWKTIENANMATDQFKRLAITVGQQKGKIKEGQVTVEKFRDSLSGKDTNGWFDNEVMMEVFRQYGEAADKIQAYSLETGRTATDIIRDIRNGNKQIQKEVGITADSLAFKAFEAAQQATTFQEVVLATSDAVSSKWVKIFENIFGNYEQAKVLWTDLSNDLWEIFAGPLDTMVEITDTWNSGFIANPQNALQKLFASGRLNKLENGLNYVSKAAAELAVANNSATYSIETLADGTQQIVKLVEKAPGVYDRFTKKIYDADKELLSGRDLLIGGFRNILRTFIFDWKETNKAGKVIEHKSIFTTIKDGLKEVIFGTSDMEKIVPMVSKKLWDMTKRFNELTEKMMPSEETLGKIKNAFKGLFTIFKIGGKFFSPILKQFQKLFGIGSGLKTGKRTILDLADSMGTWVQELDKWLDKNKVFETVSKKVSGWFVKLKTGIDNLSIALTGLTVKNFSKKIVNKVFGFFADLDFQKMFDNIGGFFTGIVTQIRQVITDDLPDELTPLQKFLVHAKKIFGGIKTFFKSIGPTFKTIGGKVGKAFMFVVNGIVKTVKDIKDVATGNLPEELSPIQKFLLGFGKVFAFFKKSYEKIITTFPKLIEKIKSFKFSDLNTLFSPIKNFWLSAKTFVGDAVKAAFGKETTDGMSKAARRLAPIVRALKSIFDGLGDLFDSAGPYIEKAGKWIGEFLSNIGKNLDKFVGNKSGLEVIESLVTLFKDFSLGKLFLSVAKVDKRFAKILKMFQKDVPKTLDDISKSVKEVLGSSKSGISGFFNRLLDYITNRKTVGKALVEDLESIRDIFKAYKREINAEALIDFAIAIGILAGSMWLLSKIPSEKLVSVGKAIFQIAVVVAGLYAVGKLISGLGTFISGKYGTKQNPIVAAIKDILTSTIKSSIFANDATAKFLKFAAGVALIALAIKWISGSMEGISKGIITLGKAYANPKFKDGLKVLGMLAGGLAITSFISSIGGAGIFTSIATFALFLIFVKRAKKLVGQITELGESTNGTSFYKGLEYMAWLLAGLAAMSVMTLIVSYSSFLGVIGTLGIILTMALFVKVVSKALAGLAKEDPDKLSRAADTINKLMLPLLAFALLSSILSRNRKSRSAMGKAILSMLAGTLMIHLIAKSLMKLADGSVDPDRIEAAASIITSIMTSILLTFGVLTLLSGLKGRFKAYVSYNGKAGAFFAALGFVGICFGIKMMAEALQGIASIGDETKISKAADIMTGLILAVGIAQGLLTLASGSNIVAGSSGYSGILGTAFGVGGFIAMCYGIKKLVEALQDIASIGNTDLIDKASEVIKSLITTVGVTEGLLTLFSGFNIGAIAGPVAVGFSGTLGAVVGIGAFVAACYGIKKLVDALVMLADSGNILKIAMAESIMEKLIVIVRHTTELLGLMAGFNIGAILPGVGVGFLGSLGVPLGAWSFVQACNGIKVMAEAMTELSGISDSDLSEAKLNSLEKLVNIAKSVFSLKIGDFFLSGSGIKKTKAQAFAEVVQPIKELMAAVSSISGEDYDPEAAQNVIYRLQEVATIATDVFNADWFSSDKTIDNIGAKASAFGEVVEPIQDLLYAISSISGEGYDSGKAMYILSNLQDVVDLAKDIFDADFWNSDDRAVAIATKAGAFSEVSEGIVSLMSTITDLYSMELPGIDAASGADLGSGISAFIDAIVSAYTTSINDNAQPVYDAAIELTKSVEGPIVSIVGEAYAWGEDLANSFASGIRAGEDAVMLSASYIAETVHAILGFSEPEKGPLSDFHTYAPDMIKLWNKGIYDNIGSVRESSYSVADSVYDGFSTALDYVSDLIDNGMSDQLTIRPIMDLSEIQNGMNSMSGMLSSADGYQITGTTKLAASAAYGIGVKPEVQQTTQPELVEAGAINNTFYITNNDPNVVAEKVSKIISGQVRRQKAVWAR